MEFLKRSFAPLTERQWEEIDKRAREIFQSQLFGRRIVDVLGPFGWEYSSHPLGEVEVLSGEDEVVKWGLRKSLPLVEVRATFRLNLWELDNVERGKKVPDLSPLEEVARKVAEFEDETIFEGCEKSKIKGLLEYASARKVASSTEDVGTFLGSLVKALEMFARDGIEGPYHLVINTDKWAKLVGKCAYPIEERVEDLLGGELIVCPRIEGALVVSGRGGDFELILGQDLSIGYEDREKDHVRLFITETFTFHVVTPEALVCLEL